MGRQDTRGGRMKITRSQLRKLINESIYGSGYYKPKVPNPVDYLSPEDREDIEDLITHEDEDLQRVGYDLATNLQQDQLVFPQNGEPYEDTPYKGYDYLDDSKGEVLKNLQINLKNAYDEFTKIGALGKIIQPGDPEFDKKNDIAEKVNKALKAALEHSKKIADAQGKTPNKVFRELFGPYLPRPQRWVTFSKYLV